MSLPIIIEVLLSQVQLFHYLPLLYFLIIEKVLQSFKSHFIMQALFYSLMLIIP